MGMYTIIIALLGAAAGWFARDTWGMWKQETKVIEVIKESTKCRGCNKLRREVEAAVLDAERRNSPYPIPMVGTGKNRRVHWELIGEGIAPQVGNKGTTAARASPPPH